MTLREIAAEQAANVVDLLESEDYFGVQKILDQDDFDVLVSNIADSIIEAVEGV